MEDEGKAADRIHLVQSDEAEPKVRLSPGKRYEVTVTTVVDSDFRAIEAETERPATRPARLCGSRSTCVAIVEID